MDVPELETSAFVLPETMTKTTTERVIVLNSIAKRVAEARRRKNAEYVFTYHGHPVTSLHNSGWKTGWKKAGLPMESGVHNLRHSFGRRLRGTGVVLETRKLLLGHTNGDITTHYSAAELGELLDAYRRSWIEMSRKARH